MDSKKVAVMQPYLFPYVGYFQLIYSADVFVLYDNVHYIKGGWINRNNFLVSGQRKTLTVPLEGASSNKLIQDIQVDSNPKAISKVVKSIYFNYSKCKFFSDVFPIVESVLSVNGSIAKMAHIGIEKILSYLDLDRELVISSRIFGSLMEFEREQRLIEIVKSLGGSVYINMEGGADMYSFSNFKKNDLSLLLLKAVIREYEQPQSEVFIGGLSILDILMNCSKDVVLEHLRKGELYGE